jgi:hypothetical protein
MLDVGSNQQDPDKHTWCYQGLLTVLTKKIAEFHEQLTLATPPLFVEQMPGRLRRSATPWLIQKVVASPS